MKLIDSIKLACAIYFESDSQSTKFAKDQLERAGFFHKSFYDGRLGEAAMQIITLFAAQNHSVMSASMLRNILIKLLDQRPINQIYDTPESWNEVDDNFYQHKELSSVFKKNNFNYDIDKYAILDDTGEYTDSISMYAGKISFPYLPGDTIIVEKKSIKYLAMYLKWKWHYFWMAKGY
jgi:hypothetical protein